MVIINLLLQGLNHCVHSALNLQWPSPSLEAIDFFFEIVNIAGDVMRGRGQKIMPPLDGWSLMLDISVQASSWCTCIEDKSIVL